MPSTRRTPSLPWTQDWPPFSTSSFAFLITTSSLRILSYVFSTPFLSPYCLHFCPFFFSFFSLACIVPLRYTMFSSSNISTFFFSSLICLFIVHVHRAFRKNILVESFFDYLVRSMIIPVMMYADKFAVKQGIKHDQLFYLMLSSVMVCIKFWDDTTSLKNAAIAQAFNYSLKSVNSIERNFLKGLDYNLSLNLPEILQYIEQITTAPYKPSFAPLICDPALVSQCQQSNAMLA
jgi:hypothetical protein